MAVLKQRLNRKNSSGTYDTIYLETIATVVKMSETDSTKLSDKISNMDTAIAGKQPAGSYAAANHNHNGVYQPAGSYAAANHSHNGANLSYDSTRSINDVINNNYSLIVNANNEINNLKTSVSNGKSAVASAITDKGVSTSATASFNTMANNIRKIVTSNIYTINNFNNELISDDKITHYPCYEYGSGNNITYHAENTSLQNGRNYFYFNMKLNNYTQVELYTGANKYPLYLSIYEYNPGDFSTILLKASSSGYYNGYQNLGFTTDPNKLYLLRVSGGNYYMGCRFK